jgi:hypothetical protein
MLEICKATLEDTLELAEVQVDNYPQPTRLSL